MIEKLDAHWDKTLTVILLILTGFVEAFSQAVTGSTAVACAVPTPLASPKMHYVPLLLLIAAGAVWLVGRLTHKKIPDQKQLQAETTQALALPQAGVLTAELPTFKFDDYFRVGHASQLTEQTMRDFKTLVAQQHPNDREDALARFIGMGYWGYTHEITWVHIYRSQILALTELNAKAGFLPLASIRSHYDKAALEYPTLYAHYTFDQWIGFMFERKLFLKRPAEVIEITVPGRDFLKFMTHWGWIADMRKN